MESEPLELIGEPSITATGDPVKGAGKLWRSPEELGRHGVVSISFSSPAFLGLLSGVPVAAAL